ncbi:DUF2399 domain-containing protein [Goodfellowiella coeruleoviolacea]|uniref:DUF2399 domain-containing protein n=1 Tax=Goodfellowiella coeruleoviolacea TaxID=334858 RepID=UPI0038993E8D
MHQGSARATVIHLLHRLASVAAVLRYHGDFDWNDIHIGNVLFGRDRQGERTGQRGLRRRYGRMGDRGAG